MRSFKILILLFVIRFVFLPECIYGAFDFIYHVILIGTIVGLTFIIDKNYNKILLWSITKYYKIKKFIYDKRHGL